MIYKIWLHRQCPVLKKLDTFSEVTMSKTNEFKGRPVGEYSESFKRQVIREIDSGRLGWEVTRRKYGIGGHSTIQRWHSSYSKTARNSRSINMISTEQEYQDH